MAEDRFVRATFEPIGHTYTLSVVKNGAGDGTVVSSPAGIDCGGVCDEDFLSATDIELSAEANGDSVFVGWGGDCSGSGTCIVTMSAARSVTATFHSTTIPQFVIYDDALASGWQDWSWDTVIDLNGTSPTWNGSAFAVNATITGAWGAFSPAMASGSVDTIGYDSIKFYVHGGTAPDKALSFVTENDSGLSTSVQFAAVAGIWTEVTVTLDQLGNPDSIARLYFQNASDSPIGMVTFDDIRMDPSTIGLFGDGFESGDTLLWSTAVQRRRHGERNFLRYQVIRSLRIQG